MTARRSVSTRRNAAPRRARRSACPALALFVGVAAALAYAQEPASAPAGPDPADLALVRADESARIAAFDRAARAVVCIFADARRTGGGSGVIFDERGYGLTNFHVVAEFVESRRGVGGLSDGNLYPLTVLGIDPGGDIAMFKLSGKPRFDAAPLADSDELIVGQWAAAMGNPFILAEDYVPTITLGIISGLNRYQEGQGNALEYADCIQVSSSINPGNSGGPLFDLAGRIIGINGRGSFEERGRVNVGLGYAVSINQIRRFLPSLRAGRLCEHGTLGATVSLAGNELIFDAVQDAAPASDAGVLLGDGLLAVNDRPMRTPNDFNNIMATLPADWPVRLTLSRDGRSFETVARLERLPIRKLPTFILDLKHNHSELQQLLSELRAAFMGGPAAPTAHPWRGVLADETDAQSVNIVLDESGVVCVESADGETLLYGATAASGAEGDSSLWHEWSVIAQPLIAATTLEVGWEFIGGDELDGRIVSVIERRTPSRDRVRWYFDRDASALLEVTVDRADAPRTLWRPAPSTDPAAPFGRTWTRYGPEGFTILSIEPPAAAPPAAEAVEAAETEL